jgi:NADPH-dependent 2,4-dienoyl-CoA reductase/sulfur reductase-like enzyme
MTRALICDADLPAKARDGRAEDIRACIGCNQACIGHFFLGAPISCIQNPLSGREIFHTPAIHVDVTKSVMVVGGGPAGMKAAVEAALRGHKVQLLEATAQLGGQARLAQLLPGRAEFGGLITNLQHELSRAQVQVTLNSNVTPDAIAAAAPDAIILATGATPRPAPMEGEPAMQVLTAEAVLEGAVPVGKEVVIADWRCDWIGIGLAERFAAEGSRVRLVVNGAQPGEEIMSYMRDHAAGRLFTAGVEVIPYARLFGAEGRDVYFEHVTALQPIILEGVDTLITVVGNLPRRDLADALAAQGQAVIDIGDCRAPRTAEEAVLEGFEAALAL